MVKEKAMFKMLLTMLGLIAVMLVACQAPQPTPTSAPVATQAATAAPTIKSEPTAASAPTKAAQLQKVRLSYSATTAFQSLMWVAKDRGLYEKYGLDAEVTNIATVQQIAAVTAGQVDIGITSADNVASAILSGADLKEIGLFVPYIEAQFYGRPEIKSAPDLKGKLAGVPTAGPGIQRHATEYALRKIGLEPQKDVEIRVFNTTNDAFAAAKAGLVQGIALFPPDNLAAEKAGFNLLYDVAKDHVLYPSGSTYTTNKFIKEHPDLVLAYLKATSEALAVYKTDPDFAISTYMKWTKLDDREVAKSGWDVYGRDMPNIPKWWPDPMQVTLNALSTQIDKAKTASPTSLYDNSFIEQLEKDGLYAQLEKLYPQKK
jgi:ABC-type nitrate/sulfonate/bicarbonate transport system substrate-binding protein